MQVHVPAEDTLCTTSDMGLMHWGPYQCRSDRGKCKAFLDEKQVEGHHSNFCVRDKAEDYKIIT